MDATKINKYAQNIIISTWPKFKKHMVDRDIENVKLVEEILIKFKNELTNEFLSKNSKTIIDLNKENKTNKQGIESDTEKVSVVTFKTNFKSGVIPPFQIWKRGTDTRILDYSKKSNPTFDADKWSEELHLIHAIIDELDPIVINEGIRKYYPEAEITSIEKIDKDKIDLNLFSNFRGNISL